METLGNKGMKPLALLLGCVILLAGCQDPRDNHRKTIDFNEVAWYAKRAAVAYQDEAAIRQAYPNTVLVATTSRNVQYFLERDPAENRQIITVRGTDNLANAREDAEYILSRNAKLGIYVHEGFDEDAHDIFQALLPRLDKSQQVIVTGHSLGAAIATLLMMYLHEEGFDIGPSINFGQPKVTNHKGVSKYGFLPLMRAVDENDVVPLVPPDDLIDAVHGGYEHLGQEVILLEGVYYVYADQHIARELSVGSFWKNLGEESVTAHYMKHYLHNIQSKLSAATQIPYDQREKYIDN